MSTATADREPTIFDFLELDLAPAAREPRPLPPPPEPERALAPVAERRPALPARMPSERMTAAIEEVRDVTRRIDSTLPPAPAPFRSWGQEVAERTAAQARAAREQHRALERTTQVARGSSPVPVIPAPAQPRPALAARDLVAGADAAAEGILLGWSGSGELSRGRLREALREAGVPETWLPKSKSPRAQAGAACEALASCGYVVRSERAAQRAPGKRSYTARWYIGAMPRTGMQKDVGSDFGVVAMTATLTDEVLTVEAHPDYVHQAQELRLEYARRIEGELYSAGEVTDWLRYTLRQECGALRFGGVMYVPARARTVAESVCEAVSHAWGTDWLLPALPVATGAALQRGLAGGLQKEATDVMVRWYEARDTAQAERRTVGVKAAGHHYGRLKEVAARVREYGALLGPELDGVLARLRDAESEIATHLNDAALRGAMLELL